MKERIVLSKNVKVGDAEASAVRPNYMYMHPDGVTFYFEPNFVTPIRLVYPGPGREDGPSQVIATPAVANQLQAALNAALALCKARMETPFVREPTPEAPIELP